MTKTDNKELSTVFNISSGVLGATNLVAFSGGKLINAATFDREIVRGTQYENVVRQLAEDVRANASEIAANSDAKNIQIRILDNEIALAQANNKSEIVNELQKAKKALNNAKNIKELVHRNVSYEDFIKTFNATDEQYKIAFKLWGEEKWDELYKFFKENNLNGGWPPFNGAKSISKIEKGEELAGKVFDRFQGPGRLKGEYASPILNSDKGVEDLIFTYDSRALQSEIKEGTNYIKFRFKNNLPQNLEFEYSEIVPWFERQGLGQQVKSSINFEKLDDYVEILEQLQYTNGKWKKIK